jgi:hypothetical protein
MQMKKNSKKLIVFVAVMMLTLSFASSGFAANTMSNLKAYYKNITVYKNGGLFNFSHEPFIVDGTTYVPLRDMAEMVDKEVTWDGVSYKIGVNDKPGQSTVELTQQVFNQQLTISQLETKIKNLESQLEEKEESEKSTSLKDLANDLLDDYDQIVKNVKVSDISISGSKNDVEVEVTLNLKDTESYDAWEELVDDDMGKIEKYLQKIVNAILDIEKYEDADITGVIYDKYEKEDLIDFEIDSRGNVETY